MDTTGSLFLPGQHSTMAGEVDALFNFILYASTVVFAIVLFSVIFFMIRYRRRGKLVRSGSKDHNLVLEILWTSIPTVLIIIVFFWGFDGFMRQQINPRGAKEIKVTGQKWFWSFDYPEGATSVNELVVPVNKPVKLLMSSTDVIHSFFVPSFRIKMDVLPNRYTISWFEPTTIGEFDLYCTEFCGKGHSEMIGKVQVVSDSAFQAWIDANSTLGEGLTLEEYGEQLYTQKACVTCHSLDGSILTGPSFMGAFGHEVALTGGERVMVDENYIRESILSPKAKIVNGFEPVMPTFQNILKDRQVDALVAFIKSLNTETTGQTNDH